MHRWTISRLLIAAVTLSTIYLFGGAAYGEPNGGRLATNHEAAIEVADPALPESNDSDETLQPDSNYVGPSVPHEAGSNGVSEITSLPSKESQPLGDGDDESLGMVQAQNGPASATGERSRALINPNSDDQATSRFGLIPGGDSDFIQVAGALVIVVTLLFVFRFVMVRASNVLTGGRPSGVMEILARYPVARGQHLSLIKLGRRILLVHQNGSAMNTLSEISDPNEVAALLSRIEAGSSDRDADRFRSLLSQYQREHETTAHQTASQRSDRPLDTRDAQGEIIDLTRSQMGGLRNLFGYSGGTR